MAVVNEFKIGNTHIIIDDEFCVGKEESEKIRKRLEDKVNLWVREGTYKLTK